MTTNPLTPEEIAEVRKLSARLRFLMSDNYGVASDGGDHAIAEMDAANWLDRLLSAVERLAACERQLAEADAAHAKLSHVKRSNFDKVGREISYADAARWAAEAVKRHASRHPKESEHAAVSR